ncbi:hypothetical protein QYE76_008983 [Lolium multiflorum]|uniref:Uncharacterized protein n=1 Tax=Lolium multiflorum TaxID=4521 RepID=A0AAD8TR40_LOLMU|nr:hypothetical protein QYE76_008983 [Lolium multiflorum]
MVVDAKVIFTPMDNGCRGCSSTMSSDRDLGLMESCKLIRDIGAQTNGGAIYQDLRGVISSLEAFASQFTSLEADKIRLQEEAKSSSSKLDIAIKKAAIARQEVDSLKEELKKLKERLKEEEARTAEKDELLRQSALALLDMASSINFNQFLEKEKLKSNGSNFTDWFRHVRIFLNGGNLQYVLDAPLGDPPAETETDEVKNVYMTRKTRPGINRVLQSPPPSYKNFVMNYNMRNMNKEFPELFGMLKAAEIEIKKEHQVLMVNKTTSFKK